MTLHVVARHYLRYNYVIDFKTVSLELIKVKTQIVISEVEELW